MEGGLPLRPDGRKTSPFTAVRKGHKLLPLILDFIRSKLNPLLNLVASETTTFPTLTTLYFFLQR